VVFSELYEKGAELRVIGAVFWFHSSYNQIWVHSAEPASAVGLGPCDEAWRPGPGTCCRMLFRTSWLPFNSIPAGNIDNSQILVGGGEKRHGSFHVKL
jgi:hypothetical protein